MPDYKNGKIYKLWSPEGNEIYIGATIQPLYKRFHHHKSARGSSSKILFEKYNDVRIELVEEYSCDNKEQLTKREGEHIRNTNCINKNVAGRTQKEYNEDNKEKISEQKKEYRENNKDKIKEWRENNKEKLTEYNKEYRENNKEKLTEYVKEYNKEYYENNKDKIKEYYENNKEKISEQHSQKYTCECGRTITINKKSRHERTLIHCNWVKSSGNGASEPVIP